MRQYAAGMAWRRRRERKPPSVFEADDECVTRRRGGEVVEQVRWADLSEVVIRTTSEGPWLDDVFWLLRSSSGGAIAVPSEELERLDLLPRLSGLPGFDNDAVIAAMGCTADAFFHVWPPSGDGVAAE